MGKTHRAVRRKKLRSERFLETNDRVITNALLEIYRGILIVLDKRFSIATSNEAARLFLRNLGLSEKADLKRSCAFEEDRKNLETVERDPPPPGKTKNIAIHLRSQGEPALTTFTVHSMYSAQGNHVGFIFMGIDQFPPAGGEDESRKSTEAEKKRNDEATLTKVEFLLDELTTHISRLRGKTTEPQNAARKLSESRCTAREIDIARRINEGGTPKIIAFDLGISESTVKNHLSSIYRKLQIGGRVELVRLLAEKQFIPD